MKPQHRHLVLSAAAAVAYGLLAFFAFNWRDHGIRLPTVGFLVAMPIVMASISVWSLPPGGTGKELIALPLATGALFLALLYAMGEGVLCLMAIALPILLTTSAVVALLATRRRRAALAKLHPKTLLLWLLAPFALAEAEVRFASVSEPISLTSSVVVAADPATIWSEIVEVRPIANREFRPGMFARLGIPVPRFATVDAHREGGTRIGHFDGGIRFVERITAFAPGRSLALAVRPEESSLPAGSFARHALASGVFRLNTVRYDLEPGQAKTGTTIRLSATYELRTTINPYGRVWADAIMSDFQQRMLQVIAGRAQCPRTRQDASAHLASGSVP